MHVNNLSNAQLERLSILLEELGEVHQMIGKVLRFGYNSSHPDFPDTNNRIELAKEIGHVERAISLLVLNRDIDESVVIRSASSTGLSDYVYYQDRL